MSNKLLSMSLQELWRLFPIRLVPHDPRWGEYFRQEREILRGLLQDHGEIKIHHIGSTAVSGIWAKPIVDILIECSDIAAAKQRLVEAGYLLMSEKGSRCSLNKGYTEAGFAERVFHVHLRNFGDADEIFFRDFLRANADIAARYEALKLELYKRFEFDRDAYTAAKSEFVLKFTRIAKENLK